MLPPTEKRRIPLLWMIIALFLMIWAFILGLLVGQGVLGTGEQMADLRALPAKLLGRAEEPPPPAAQAPDSIRETALASPQTADPVPLPDFSFYQEVERKPDLAAEEPKPKPAETAAPDTERNQADQTKPATAEAKPANNAPAPQPRAWGTPQPYRSSSAPAAKPAPAAPAAAPGAAAAAAAKPPAAANYLVQVASFREEFQARELVSQLKAAGYQCHMSSTQVQGVGARIRVRVGPFENQEQAEAAAGRIKTQNKLSAFVVKE